MRMKNKHIIVLAVVVTLCCVYFFVFGRSSNEENSPNWESRRVLRFDQVTRDSSRIITYSYPISNNFSISNETIDISKAMPDWKELDHRIVVVTGFSQHLAYFGLGMIASVQAHMPLKKIIVYNLGIHPKLVKTMKQMCNVEVRRFNFDKYPKHVQNTKTQAWRVFALLDVLNEFGGYFYVDPRVRFRAPINLLIPFVSAHGGFIAKMDKLNTTLEITHPTLYHLFGLHMEDFNKHFPKAPAMSQDAFLVVNSSVLHTKIWTPLVTCAMKFKCIAPYGSTPDNVVPYGRTHTHRYDFTATALLLYRTFLTRWYTDSRMNAMLDKIHDTIEPGGVHDYIWAHYCNPPKSEVDCSVHKNRC
ncbi:uncharacterized protein LOC117296989 [Asterias rubens]|uniref:uncharacterized protein LOC117296989 n=1 Tax=Asterias rubens TaxID=7604 RepID=UPI00145545B1|nr:uncharacterized protein LOC117296989 [Asterias rubens]